MKPTILVIDDDPVDIKALAFLLESWDYHVILSRSGEEGLAVVASVPVDVVVADVRMPGMSGIDVVEAVEKQEPGLPIILITGHGDVRTAVQAMKIGAFDYVIKPPNEDEFKLIVARALEHSRLRRENAYLRAELAAGGLYGDRLLGRRRTRSDRAGAGPIANHVPRRLDTYQSQIYITADMSNSFVHWKLCHLSRAAEAAS